METEYTTPAPHLMRATGSVIGGAAQQRVSRDTPLDRVESLANYAEQHAYNIETFIARFRGMPQSEGVNKLTGVPAGHEGQLSRLADALNRIECLTSQLAEIG